MAKKQRVYTTEFKQEAVQLTDVCSIFCLEISGYSAWLKRGKSQRAGANEPLLQEIEQIFHAHRSVYGSPRIHVVLRDIRGVKIAMTTMSSLHCDHSTVASIHSFARTCLVRGNK